MLDKITRRKALKQMGLLGLSPIASQFMEFDSIVKKPNIIVVLCDQYRADACRREGFELDTTPFLDSLAREGVWFDKAYCAAPACVPSRTAMQTGRFPSATRVKSNHNVQDAVFTEDLLHILKARGYCTATVGKILHSYLGSRLDRYDYAEAYTHLSEPDNENPRVKEFNAYLRGTNFYADYKPAPFPVEMQQPYRIVSDGISWISSVKERDEPFYLYLSIPEPHNPYQVSEPYYSLFPPEDLPPLKSNKNDLEAKGKKFTMLHQLEKMGYPDYEKHIPRVRSNYYGMMRLIDDQMKRLAEYLKKEGIYDDTVFLFVADHGDYTGEYGLIKKGAGLPDCLARIPMLWSGPGIKGNKEPHGAHVSNIDIMPTFCSMVGYPIPDGVMGRSLWPLLKGTDYPKEEFSSVIAQGGFGGRDYTSIDQLNPYKEGALVQGEHKIDELNSYTQSGVLRGLRKKDWKLIYNMQGNGRLYHISEDPGEVNDLYSAKEYRDKRLELIEDMLTWELRSQDSLPLPRQRYIYRHDKYNYWTPYNDPAVM